MKEAREMAWRIIFRTSIAAVCAIHAEIANAQNSAASSRTAGRYELGGSSHLEIAGLSLPAVEVAADGPIVAFTVDEAVLGSDLNGDGDTTDTVLHVYDATAGMVTNLRLAGEQPKVAGSTVAFKVYERDQGHTDLNGDGDRGDFVEFVYDAATRTTTNLGLATINVTDSNITPVLVPFLVWEAAEETDLNGDGDTDDFVVHVYDTRTHGVTNLGVASRTSFGNAVADGAILAIAVDESAQGTSDLNQDGDAADRVVFVYDANSLTLTNLGITNSDFGLPLQVRSENVIVNVAEAANVPIDLNGDGDTADIVPLVYDPQTGTIDNLGVSGRLFVSGSLGALFVSESDQGHADLNADGDTDDTILFAFDLTTHSLTNLHFAAARGSFGLSDDLIAWAVPEEASGGGDLNGDGDATDLVVHVFNPTDQTVTNTMLACPRQFAGSSTAVAVTATGNLAVFAVNESEQGMMDLNGDGDALDNVVHLFDVPSHSTHNLALALNSAEPAFNLQAAAGLAAFRVSENAQGDEDLNGDGDTLDRVVYVLDHTNGQLANTGLASRIEPILGANIVLVFVDEAAQGATDLDRNGSAADCCVLSAISPRTGSPCTAGTVNARNGGPAPVLRVNGATDLASAAPHSPITVSLAASPSGPSSARYALWVWRAASERDVTVFAPNGSRCGCLIAPSPLHPGQQPQPLFCLNGGLPIGPVCGGSHHPASAPRAPWSLIRSGGLAHPIALVFQGLLQDAANTPAPIAVTNAVRLEVL
jgi:hypothetical protein